MDIKNRILEVYQSLLGESKLLTQDKLKDCYQLFQSKFSPGVLKGLDGEVLLDTIFNHSNKNSLVYWLEFKSDEELPTNSFGGIGGGSALKFGIFKRKEDSKWISGSSRDMRELDLAEAIAIAREKRDLLVKGAEIIATTVQDTAEGTYRELQKRLDDALGTFGNLGWVHKYFHMLYPDRVDDFHSVDYQIFYLLKMKLKPMAQERYVLAGQYMRLAQELKLDIHYLTTVLMAIYGPMHNYWRIGTTDSTQSYWAEMVKSNYALIGWSSLGDLKKLDDLKFAEAKEQIKENLTANLTTTPQAIGRAANQILLFYRYIKENDIIVAAQGQSILGIGRVTGGYQYQGGLTFPHSLGVTWLKAVNTKLPNPSEGLQTTVYQYKDQDNLIAIEGLLADSSIPGVTPSPGPDSNQGSIPRLEPLTGRLGQVEGILNRKKQLIFYGPPGTGKTYWAEKACLELAARKAFHKSFDQVSPGEREAIIGKGNQPGLVRFCCFHPSYSYEDFIEGIKPTVINNQTVFSLKAGIFKELCAEARGNGGQDYFLIIDEINRGDISRIFGELITIIEAGKRGKALVLPLSGDSFSVPENVFIVGTMNTADRSIALLDVALRRRFGFVELLPEYSLLRSTIIEGLPIGPWLEELNKRIVQYVGRDARNLQIGHSYFMEEGQAIKDFNKLVQIIEEDIIPLIEEYCYGDYHTIAKILGNSFVEVGKQQIKDHLFKAANKRDLIAALLETSPDLATTLSVQTAEDEELYLEDGEEQEEWTG